MSEWGAEAERYARDAAFVPALAGGVLDLLAPRPGERILDLGCGDGTLTERIAASGCEVLGVDADASMVAAARARGLSVEQRDGQALDLDGGFDAVFSNAALHWMPDAAGVLRGVHHALEPAGRFVAEFGGFGNVAAICSAARAVLTPMGLSVPHWFFPTPAAYHRLLGEAGLVVDELHLIHRPTHLPSGMVAWLETFLAGPLGGLSAARRAEVTAAVADLLAPSLRDERGEWWADYVRLRCRATRP